jgi:soluble lytic murein transglycosylase-like protein
MKRKTTAPVLYLLALVFSMPLMAADQAVLRNGFTIRLEQHEEIGTQTRLYLDGSGKSFVDVPTAEIVRYEPAPAELKPSADQDTAIRSTPAEFDLDAAIERAGRHYQLDPDLLRCVIHAESDFKIKAVSPKGARGLMQLMPATAKRLGVADSFDPAQNIEAGAQHLRNLLDRYHNDLVKALAAYNAGTDPVEQYRGVPPYRETRAYVSRIIREFNRIKESRKLAARGSQQASSGSILLIETSENRSGQ